MRFWIPFLIFFLCLCSFIQGRPNPVPNDELDEKQVLEEYEKNHNKNVQSKRVKRHRRIRRPEDPEDQDVLDELEDVFVGIRRRNRDFYPQRVNIFQKFIDEAMFSHDEESHD
jgi:hypothetical protein